MTPNEKQDLEIMHSLCADIRKRAFSAMNMVAKYTQNDLKNSGYETIDQAIAESFRYYNKQIQEKVAEHIKKYPDSR